MNINSVNQNLPVQNPKDSEVKRVQSAEIRKKNIGIAIEEKEKVFSGAKAAGLCCTVVETDGAILSELFGQEEASGTGNEAFLDYTANHMTEEDYEDLEDEGYSIEEFEAERLERALARRKENHEFLESSIDTRIEKKEAFREDIEKIAISSKISDPMAKRIAQKLLDSNLPVTDANVEAMLSAMQLSDVVTRLSEDGMAALIEKEAPITLEHIYQSQYTSIKVQPPGQGLWQAVAEQAEEILVDAGIEATQENMEKAKWLFDHNLPISENTFDTYDSLLVLRGGIDEDMLLTKMAEAMGRGMAPEQADLNIVLSEKMEQAVADFDTMTEEAVGKVLEEGEKLNLVHLRNAKQALEQEAVSSQAAGKLKSESFGGAEGALAREASAETFGEALGSVAAKSSPEITAYRQLEEIRLKLTLEAAQALAGKGIRIDTSQLQRIVEGLKEMERQYYENLLDEGRAERTEANISLLRQTTETVAGIRRVPAAVLGATLKVNVTQSIDSLYKTGMEWKASYEKADAAYEALMTAPRKDMGDSIQKAFRNVDGILESLDMEATADNQRAVRILGYNRMEINENSITAVKAYDSQVTSLLSELHPAATVELIKRGINPLDMPMEQLIDEVKGVKKEIGITDGEKYSTYLWKLERQGGISEEERKSYIGIYRLLNNVEKTDGAAIGSVLDTGKELTMGNLLTAVRTMKHGGMDVEVNDAFGALESLTFQRETITDQIQAGLTHSPEASSHGNGSVGVGQTTVESVGASGSDWEQLRKNQVIYQENLLDAILEEITPEKLGQVTGDDSEEIMDMSLEQLKEQLSNAEEDGAVQREYLKEKVEAIRNVVSGGNESVEFLERFGQPVSIGNLAAASEYFTGNKNIFRELQSLSEHLAGDQREAFTKAVEELSDFMDADSAKAGSIEAASIEDVEALQKKYEEFGKKAEELLNEEYGNRAVTSEDLRNLSLLGKGVALIGSMSRQEHYEIPMKTGDTITNVSLTIRRGTGEKGKLQISMNSEQFGRIEIEASIKEQAINGVILCETREGLLKLTDCRQQMQEGLEDLGLTVKQLSIAISDKALEGLRSSGDHSENQTETRMLYRAAKVLVQQLKAAWEQAEQA